ncbi:PREDICTED: uncharacterized protein LOC106104367 isoform X2 [Papilio polytes]|uniref:uncharacterized protein LOC106104367 isoform X2 n=1 Tax=Papilio polytes TaxID=76194 RepID=UPI00067643E5|nr:PREDICTED: uncharacterized protein LOC106104367 isoform X2 [Papilio polytes]
MKSETYSQNNEGKFKFKCSDLTSFCGRDPRKSVMFVGVTGMVASLVILLCSVTYLLNTTSLGGFSKKPMSAVNLIFSLVSTSLSIYQIVISFLLFLQTFWVNSSIFLCSLWYVSHLSILIAYGILYIARSVVCFMQNMLASAAITIFVGFVYEAVFIYFCVVVNTYMNSLNQVRYF